MIKKDKVKFADGSVKTYYRVTQGYRPKPGAAPKQRTIKKFGYIEDQSDPDAFLSEIKEFNDSFLKNNADDCEDDIEMYTKYTVTQNYGYKFIESIYNLLRIDSFIDKWMFLNSFRDKADLKKIFKFLILQRIMLPASKRATFANLKMFYDFDCDFNLQNIYRALDKYALMDIQFQKYLHSTVSQLTQRDMSYAFYDVTNYYTEIDFADPDIDGKIGLRKKGVSKEHRLDPIVQMGLFMDANGIPVAMETFPGNTSDTLTFIPTLNKVKDEFKLQKIIAVADKGMNSSTNIDHLVNQGDGFVFSQILKGTKGKRYHAQAFSEDGWTYEGNNRYKTFIEEYNGKDEDGKKVVRKRKVLIYYNEADAKMAKHKREEKLEKAKKELENNAYGIKKGKERYTKETLIDNITGSVMEEVYALKSVDQEKAEKDAMFDGLFCIITSELDYDAKKIKGIYGGLWKIEQSFRIMKSDLEARPIYLSTEAHIKAHFLICYVALIIVRLLQFYMKEDYLTAERLADVLNAAVCQVDKGGIVRCPDVGGRMDFVKKELPNGKIVETLELNNKDRIAEDYKKLQKAFHVDFYKAKTKIEKFNRFLDSINILA